MSVTISREIKAPVHEVFEWFYDSANYSASPMVMGVKLSDSSTEERLGIGSQRIVYMVAGIYHEQITDIVPGKEITYRVTRSFPPIRQDSTQVRCFPLDENRTRVEWEIDCEVRVPLISAPLTKFASWMAGRLYSTILRAADKHVSSS